MSAQGQVFKVHLTYNALPAERHLHRFAETRVM
jgi:hypothetical protein